jgi:hypothetical protein
LSQQGGKEENIPNKEKILDKNKKEHLAHTRAAATGLKC